MKLYRMTTLYILALGIIGALSFTSYFLIDRMVSGQQLDGQIINVSGRQRMLSQRIALLIHELSEYSSGHSHGHVHEGDPKPGAHHHDDILDELENAVHLFEESHQRLIKETIHDRQPENVYAIYFEAPEHLDRRVREYVQASRDIIEKSKLGPLNHAMDTMDHHAMVDPLLVSLDKAVTTYEVNNAQHIHELRMLAIGILCLTVFILILIGFFIFQPMVRTVRDRQRQLEKQRERAEEHAAKAKLLETAIVNAKDAVLITTADLEEPGPEIIYVNEAFTRMTGYEAEDVIGKNPRMFQGYDTDAKQLALLREALEAGKTYNGELKNYTADGIAYWIDTSIVPVKNENGEVTHFASLQRDVTQRKAFEKEITIAKEAAEVANRAKGDFLANMSHELRTPMNGIIGLSELLIDMGMSKDQTELAEAINDSSRNLLILLNDLLDISKIEAGEITLEYIPFDIRRTIRQSVDLLKPMASRKGVILESSFNPIVPERIVGDPSRLQQILNNLISNAVKFTEVGYVRLDVSTSRDKNDDPVLNIRVEDTGIGIPEDKRDMIFHKFTQADVSTARKYGGTGLGLSITKQLVEMMGGEIYLDSVEGKGTTFFIEIPIEIAKADQKPVIPAQEANSQEFFNKNAKLMVVDDHPVNLLFMMKVLKKMGFHHVDEARSGMEALNLYKTKSYDVIFMDCQMPEMDGFEASAEIREIEDFTNQTKIIAVTADAMKGARERCIDAGMNDYISKPVDVEKLKMILNKWLPSQDSTEGEEGGDVVEMISKTMDEIKTLEDPQDMEETIMDWERLELFTDGDPDEEKALIDLFTSYAEESIQVLRNHCDDTASDDWKKAAHKLKGSAANLGANRLSAYCLKAEKNYEASLAEKKKMLEKIEVAYDEVQKLLHSREKV